uniref:Putative zinc-finger domain-containing protein n=1 Tax=Panagrolaimus davidi TaxID=227884 RepID=A0A914PK17_9BILA
MLMFPQMRYHTTKNDIRKPRRSTKPRIQAFNQISNAKQKFVSRRVNVSRFGSPPPPNSAHYDTPPIIHPSFTSTVPNSNEASPPMPSDSWRQDPIPPIIPPRRPLLPLPNPFIPQAGPSSIVPFFNQPPPLRQSFAPPPYRPSNATSASTFFNIPQPHFGDYITGENPGQLGARHSVDMDISPAESPMIMENCVMFVDEPLEEYDDASPSTETPVLLPSDNTNAIPYMDEPENHTQNLLIEEPHLTAEKPPVAEATTEKPPPFEISPKRFKKKFTKELLQDIQRKLLQNLDLESSSSSSSSEFEEEAKEVDELRRKLIHHNKEMHDELDKRERLVKEMETCQLMINHHYERMNAIMRSIGDASRQSLRSVRKSLSRTKSEGKRKRKKLYDSFKNGVSTIMNELSNMNEEVIIAPAPINNTPEKPAEKTLELAEVLENLIEDPGTEVSQSIDDPPIGASEPPKRIERQLVVDKAFEKECLQRMFQARFGVQPLPHIIVPKKVAKKKNSNASADVNLEREEALRQKLLEQMKKKEQQLFPSLHEKKKVVENEKTSSRKLQKNLNEEEAMKINPYPVIQTIQPLDVSTESVSAKEVVATLSPSSIIKPFKSLSDISTTVSPTAAKPKIIPTMKDIIELKKEFHIALRKRRNSNKRSASNITTTSAPSKNSPIKQNSDVSLKPTSTPVLPKPVEKENVSNTGIINPLKRSATAAVSENSDQIFKKPRQIPEKSKRLNELEIKEQEILFNSPRIAVRNFIRSPQYDIKESIERLRYKNDPNIELCYFELFGICNDEECPYQHQRDFTLNDQQILEEILGYIPHRVSSYQTENIQQQAQKLLETNSLDEIIQNLRNETSHLDFIKLAIDGCNSV